MKKLLKSEVCEFHKQYTRSTVVHWRKVKNHNKKEKEKKTVKMQMWKVQNELPKWTLNFKIPHN